MKRLNLTIALALHAVALGMLPGFVSNAKAAAYACDLTNSSGVISFRLNEAADNVKIISSSGAVTNDLGALPKGLTVTNLGISGVFKVAVIRSAASGYVQSSVDGFQDNGIYVNKFEHPRGVVVNKNPATPSFGRIFVSCARQGTTGGSFIRTTYDGIYLINADDTVALDTGTTPRTAGLGFTTGTETASPLRLTIGKDDNLLYICDLSDASGGLWYTDLDVTSGGNALGLVGGPTGTTDNHGSIYAAVVEGSLGNSDLQIFTMDEDLSPVKTAWKYEIGAGPLPFTGAATGLGQAMINSTIDLTKGGTNNYLYASQNRSVGAEAGIRIFDANGTVITDSLTYSRLYTGNSTNVDLLRNTVALDISPDGNTLAVLRGASFGRVSLIGLTNGVFDFANSNSFAIGLSSDNNRDLCYDVAGNIYIVSSSGEWLRIFSRGGATLATTGSDGTFELGVPPTLVSVSATTATADEAGPVNGVFTLTRTGDTTGALTVSYTMSGTASNGVDYASLSGSATFNAGSATTTVTVTTTDDSTAEVAETAILTVLTGGNYAAGTPLSGTVTIQDNENPEFQISTVQSRLLEGYSPAKATYKLTRLGLQTSAVTVNIGYSGAVAGTDFNGPSTVVVNANVGSTNFNITPINNTTYSGNRTITASVAAGTGYTIGTPGSADVTLIDDEFPAGTVLFTDHFDSASSNANWTVNSADGLSDTYVDWAYDYSAVGIPSAPHSTGGTTLGVRFRANELAGTVTGLSISPTGVSFGNDFRLSFDSWINYNGPLNNGGVGSTQHGSAGVGTSGTAPQWNSGGGDGVWFSWPGDGGITAGATGIRDINAYAPTNEGAPNISLLLPADYGVYAAGTNSVSRDETDPYYNLWGGIQAPAIQQTTYPGPSAPVQTGTTAVGELGFAWHNVVLTKVGGTVTWTIDGITVATVLVNTNTFTLYDNISLGYEDAFASISDNKPMSFSLVDNVRVETIAVPPPALGMSRSGSSVTLTWSGAFTLQEGSSVTGPWSDVSGATSPYMTSAATGTKFFRLRQ